MGDFNVNIKSSNCVKDKVETFSDIAVNLSNNVILFIQKSVSNKSNKLTINFFFFFFFDKQTFNLQINSYQRNSDKIISTFLKGHSKKI